MLDRDETPNDNHSSTPEDPFQSWDFQFRGTGSEYFNIWIVNTLLTLVTLGLYWPWASVRKRRYFYNQTYLDGRNFDYLGQARSIFRGFLIIYTLVWAYYLAHLIHPMAHLLVVSIAGLACPWIIYKTLGFRARTLSWSGIRPHFSGSLTQAYRIWLLHFLAVPLSLGLYTPIWQYHTARYAFENLYLGQERFQWNAKVSDYFKIYGKLLVLIIGMASIFSIVIAINSFALKFFESQTVHFFAAVLFVCTSIVAYFCIQLLFRTFLIVALKELRWHGLQIGQLRFQCSWSIRSYMQIELSNLLLISFTLGLYTPIAQIRRTEFFIDNLSLVGPRDALDNLISLQQDQITGASGEASIEVLDIDIGF